MENGILLLKILIFWVENLIYSCNVSCLFEERYLNCSEPVRKLNLKMNALKLWVPLVDFAHPKGRRGRFWDLSLCGNYSVSFTFSFSFYW